MSFQQLQQQQQSQQREGGGNGGSRGVSGGTGGTRSGGSGLVGGGVAAAVREDICPFYLGDDVTVNEKDGQMVLLPVLTMLCY